MEGCAGHGGGCRERIAMFVIAERGPLSMNRDSGLGEGEQRHSC